VATRIGKSGAILQRNISQFSKDRYYFHINDLKRYLLDNNVSFKANTLEKTFLSLKKTGGIFDAGKGWYSSVKEKLEIDREPIDHVVNMVRGEFPLVEFSCWSTEQLKNFFHHMPQQFVTFLYSDKDFLRSLQDFLSGQGFTALSNPSQKEANKFFQVKQDTIILRPIISAQRPRSTFFAPAERMLVDLFIESRALNLFDEEEIKLVVANAVTTYRVNLAELLNYAERRGAKAAIKEYIPFYPLTSITMLS
jgi:hypothetical protein